MLGWRRTRLVVIGRWPRLEKGFGAGLSGAGESFPLGAPCGRIPHHSTHTSITSPPPPPSAGGGGENGWVGVLCHLNVILLVGGNSLVTSPSPPRRPPSRPRLVTSPSVSRPCCCHHVCGYGARQARAITRNKSKLHPLPALPPLLPPASMHIAVFTLLLLSIITANSRGGPGEEGELGEVRKGEETREGGGGTD